MSRYNFVKDRIEKVGNEGYGLHLERLLSRTFNIYKKTFFLLSLVIIMYSVAVATIWFSMFEFVYGVKFVELIEMAQNDPNFVNELMSNMSFSKGLIYSLVLSIAVAFVAPIFAGINKISLKVKREKTYSLGDLFTYYQQPYFFNIIVFSFILSFVIQFLGVVFSNIVPSFGSVASLWLQIFMNVSTVFTIPFIVFGDMKWVEAIKASFKIAFKNWFFLMFVLAIGFIISYLGILLCGVGIIFTYSFLYVLIFVIYDDVIGFKEEKDEIFKIGENH